LVILFMPLYMLCWWFIKIVNYRQQTPSSLTFASPLAKLNLEKWIRSCVDAFTPQKYTCVQTRILLRIRINRSDFQTYPYYLQLWGFSLHLNLEQLKYRAIKSSTMYQVLCSTIILEFLWVFKIKLRASIVWHSQVSRYMWYLWILTKAIMMLCLSLPTTKAYVELIGMEKIWKSILAIHIL
jgi:hypothetical protein